MSTSAYNEYNFRDVGYVYINHPPVGMRPEYRLIPLTEGEAKRALGAGLLEGGRTVTRYRIRARGGWPRVILVVHQRDTIRQLYDFTDTTLSSYDGDVISE